MVGNDRSEEQPDESQNEGICDTPIDIPNVLGSLCRSHDRNYQHQAYGKAGPLPCVAEEGALPELRGIAHMGNSIGGKEAARVLRTAVIW